MFTNLNYLFFQMCSMEILAKYNRSLLLKRNSYFAWQIYTAKQVACFSISLRNQRQMDQTFIFWEKKSFTRSSLWLINYRVHNLPLQNCQHFPSFPMKWCSLPFKIRKKSKNIYVIFQHFCSILSQFFLSAHLN